MTKEIIDANFEMVQLAIKVKNKTFNFIFAYNPHFEYSAEFLVKLERTLKSTCLVNPTFIVGDLNQDLLSFKGQSLLNLMLNFNFVTELNTPTHHQQNAASLIDVLFYNDKNSLSSCNIIECPFSNHSFLVGALNLDSIVDNNKFFLSRKLDEKNLLLIQNDIKNINFDLVLKLFEEVNDKWSVIKRLVIGSIDKFAPNKKFRLRKRDNLPWVDNELTYLIAKRDKLHKIAVNSKTDKFESIEMLVIFAHLFSAKR